MAGKLILKDFKTHYQMLMLLFLAQMLAGGMFIFRFYPWNVYTMYGLMVISFASSFLYFTEKKRNTEIFNCSLPATRTTIVTARYFFSAIIAGTGIIIWIFNAWLFEQIYPNARSNFSQILHLKVLFMALLFLSIQLSLFLPAVFRFNLFGSILAFIASITIAIVSIPTLFYPYKHSYNPNFVAGDMTFVFVLASGIISVPILSAMFSISSYKRKDL